MTLRGRRIDARKLLAHRTDKRFYATHAWDKYPAKLVPHLARYAIAEVSSIEETVLDPFCGCGTVQVEAILSNRHALGVDVNPLAILLARAKSTVFDPQRLSDLAKRIVKAANKPRKRYSQYPDWLDYWFTRLTLKKLLA